MNKFLLVGLSLLFAPYFIAQTENFWTKKADFGGLKRERAVAFSIGDKGYVGTGVDTAEIVHKDFWSYDATIDVWSQIADLPGSVRRNAVAFATEGYGYVGTGIDSVNASAPTATILKDFWKYDPAINSWNQIADYPGAGGNGMYFGTAFAIDSKGYVSCGKVGPNFYVNDLWEYKPSINQWAQLPNFPGGIRYQLSSFVIGYDAYVGLGTDQDMYRKDIWKFSTINNQWTSIADLPASQRASSMTFSIGQRGYVCMGTNGGNLDDLWEYNPFTNDWSTRATYGGSSRKNGIAFEVNGKAYVGTGKGNSGKKSSFYEYTPPAVVGMEELELEIVVYPNPTSDFIKINSTSNQKLDIVLCNIYGQTILNTQNSTIDVSEIPKGSYVLIVSSGESISKQKIIIQ
jgi:N-acetylneuraminic acid mutarotase